MDSRKKSGEWRGAGVWTPLKDPQSESPNSRGPTTGRDPKSVWTWSEWISITGLYRNPVDVLTRVIGQWSSKNWRNSERVHIFIRVRPLELQWTLKLQWLWSMDVHTPMEMEPGVESTVTFCQAKLSMPYTIRNIISTIKWNGKNGTVWDICAWNKALHYLPRISAMPGYEYVNMHNIHNHIVYLSCKRIECNMKLSETIAVDKQRVLITNTATTLKG